MKLRSEIPVARPVLGERKVSPAQFSRPKSEDDGNAHEHDGRRELGRPCERGQVVSDAFVDDSASAEDTEHVKGVQPEDRAFAGIPEPLTLSCLREDSRSSPLQR